MPGFRSSDLVFATGVFLLFLQVLNAQEDTSSPVSQYNIAWETYSSSSVHSMPVGGGNLGLNVWVEDGELLFYMGSPDAHEETGMNIKLGRIRIRTTPNIFSSDFRQELELYDGNIRFKGKTPEGESATGLLWVDVEKPVIHLSLHCADPVDLELVFESWPAESPRYQISFAENGLEWMYALDQEQYDSHLTQTLAGSGMSGLEDDVVDPGRFLVLGGRILSRNLIPGGETTGKYMATSYRGWSLKTKRPISDLKVTIPIRIAQDSLISQWRSALEYMGQQAMANRERDYEKTTEWWHRFWDRSHIHMRTAEQWGTPPGTEGDSVWLAARNYQLFRYMLGCNSKGSFPTLFNGGFFNVDTPVPDDRLANQSADERLWARTGFMAQNQRLLYWPMLRSGDMDMLRVGLNFYRDRADAQYARAMKCWRIKGAAFPEPLDWLGTFGVHGDTTGHSNRDHLTYHYTSTLDFAYMMIEYARFFELDIRPYLPVIEGIVLFYDNFYRKEHRLRTGSELGPEGKLVIYPSMALEFAQGCRNNTDVLAGLDAISQGLLDLPEGILDKEKTAYFEDFRKRLPPIPIIEHEGNPYLAVAESYESVSTHQNLEFPQMYAVFPFQRYGVGLPRMDLARNTWKYGFTNTEYQKDYICWYQNGIFAARLGLIPEAADYNLKKLLHSGDPPRLLFKIWPTPSFGMRFPAFYNTFTFDHPPCMDHGGSAMIGLQEMLMQTPGKKIILFPSWPPEWDVDFKLNAPYNTVVEGELKNGKLVRLEVTPSFRKRDVQNMILKTAQ